MKSKLFILVIMTLLFNVACASNCVFDKSAFNESTYAKKQFKNSLWLSETKELKAITKSNDLLSVKHWSCNHIGFQATLLSGNSEPTPESTQHKILELGSILLEQNDLDTFISAINQQNITASEDNQMINIADTGHQQFTVNYQYIGESLLIKLLIMDN